jgi:hypothetical protein
MAPEAEDLLKDTQPAGTIATGETAAPAPTPPAPQDNQRTGKRRNGGKKSAGPLGDQIRAAKAATKTGTPQERIGAQKKLRVLQRQANAAATAIK